MFPKIMYSDINNSALDAISTSLSLFDYDWLEYSFNATIDTLNYGILHFEFTYNGTTDCMIYVSQVHNGIKNTYSNTLNIANIVTEFMKNYMIAHAKCMGTSKAFDNYKITIDFYNKIVSLVNDNE